MPGFGTFELATPRLTANSIATGIVLLVYLYTFFASGFFSGPSTLLALLVVLLYARYDFFYTRLRIEEKMMSVAKGLLLFRGRKKHTMPVSYLISAREEGGGGAGQEWELLYHEPVSGYFYAEYLQESGPAQKFSAALKQNQVAFFPLKAGTPPLQHSLND